MTRESAILLVTKAEQYMGLKPSGDRHITEEASRGLVKILEALQAVHPDLASKPGFSPYIFNDRTVSFTKAVAQKEMEGGKMPSNNAAVAYNMMEYIVNARLDDGKTFVAPGLKAPWSDKTKFRSAAFFNIEVYNELGLDLTPHDGRKYMGGQNWVSHKALFEPSNKDPAQQQMITEVARDLKITGRKLNISSDGSVLKHADNDPKAMTYYSLDEISRMATEILARQAMAICDLKNPEDITKAIMSQQYMPNLMDMKLAEHGFGKPPWDPKRLAELRDESNGRTPIIPRHIKDEDLRDTYDIYRSPAITQYQSQKWAKRFGKIDDSYIQEIAREKGGDWVFKTHLSPYAYHGLHSFKERSKTYETARNEIFFPRLNWRFYNGLDLCKIESAPSAETRVNGPSGNGTSGATIAPPQTPAAGTGTGAGATGTKPGTTNCAANTPGAATCAANPPVPERPTNPLSPSVCAANSAFSCPVDRVSDNAQDATGQTGNRPPPAVCAANANVVDCKIPTKAPRN